MERFIKDFWSFLSKRFFGFNTTIYLATGELFLFLCSIDSLVWDSELILSPDLCKLAETQLGWKRTTTYTVLKRLCNKKLLINENALVKSLVSREEIQKSESRQVIHRSFAGSLPQFIAAFLDGRKISDSEAEKIKRIIDSYREDK